MQKLNPKAVWIFFIQNLIGSLAISFFILFFGLAALAEIINVYYWLKYLLFILLLFVILIILSWIFAKLAYRFWGYQLADESFKKEQGIIWKKYASIPYERIQNIDIHRGILERFLGLSSLHIQTAGASAVVYGRGRISGVGSEGYLPGLGREVAEQLRDELVRRAKGTKQGL